MRGTAGFLRILTTIVMVILIIAIIVLAGVTAIFALAPGVLPEAAANGLLSSITIDGQPATIEMLLTYGKVVLIASGIAMLILILETVVIGKIRTALGEVRDEKPFSERCSKSLGSAGVIEIIIGIIMIAAPCAGFFMGDSVLEASALSTAAGNGISSILFAIVLFMLAKISEFGSRKSY